MALRSQIFRGDAKLESAAVNDFGHITPGACGPHVEKIQMAVIHLDGANISPRELEQDFYGESTAAAVLLYKQRRNIVNRRYQSTADNIVGKMTIAALDSEMATQGASRKRCGCNYAPVGRNSRRKQYFFTVSSFGSGTLKSKTSVSNSPLDSAMAAVQPAIAMRNKAKRAIDELISGSRTELSELCREALQRHYKVTSDASIQATAQQIKDSLARMAGRLLSARAWLKQGGLPGFAETPTPRDGHTYIMQGFPSGKLLPPTILIHEAFHDLDDFNQDFGGNPVIDNAAKYHQNDTQTQLRNAYAMSQFVVHISVGRETLLHNDD